MRDYTFIKWTSILFGTIAAHWAKVPHAEQVLLLLMAIDLAMGTLAALIRGEFSARILLIGIGKKVGMLLFLLSVHVIESIPTEGVEVDIDKWTAYALCVYEMTSLVESYVKLGGKVPPIAMRMLERLQTFLEDQGAVAPDPNIKKVETVTKRVEIDNDPKTPPAVITTITKESHTEPVVVASPAETDK